MANKENTPFYKSFFFFWNGVSSKLHFSSEVDQFNIYVPARALLLWNLVHDTCSKTQRWCRWTSNSQEETEGQTLYNVFKQSITHKTRLWSFVGYTLHNSGSTKIRFFFLGSYFFSSGDCAPACSLGLRYCKTRWQSPWNWWKINPHTNTVLINLRHGVSCILPSLMCIWRVTWQ